VRRPDGSTSRNQQNAEIAGRLRKPHGGQVANEDWDGLRVKIDPPRGKMFAEKIASDRVCNIRHYRM
jgi:hypothetical protein